MYNINIFQHIILLNYMKFITYTKILSIIKFNKKILFMLEIAYR
jgi:hypothetical protein